MDEPANEFDELRLGIERLRALLENLVVRGLRACGSEELLQLQSFVEYLERAGAGHVASLLADLHAKIEKDERGSAQAMLQGQTAVRLLERLLTLRVVRAQYESAVATLNLAEVTTAAQANEMSDIDAEDEEGE